MGFTNLVDCYGELCVRRFSGRVTVFPGGSIEDALMGDKALVDGPRTFCRSTSKCEYHPCDSLGAGKSLAWRGEQCVSVVVLDIEDSWIKLESIPTATVFALHSIALDGRRVTLFSSVPPPRRCGNESATSGFYQRIPNLLPILYPHGSIDNR